MGFTLSKTPIEVQRGREKMPNPYEADAKALTAEAVGQTFELLVSDADKVVNTMERKNSDGETIKVETTTINRAKNQLRAAIADAGYGCNIQISDPNSKGQRLLKFLVQEKRAPKAAAEAPAVQTPAA